MAKVKNNTWPVGVFILLIVNMYLIGDFAMTYYNYHYRANEILEQNRIAMDNLGYKTNPEIQRQVFNSLTNFNDSANLIALVILALINCLFFYRYLFIKKVQGVTRIISIIFLSCSVIYLLYSAGAWIIKLV